jgi:hypothetical protein
MDPTNDHGPTDHLLKVITSLCDPGCVVWSWVVRVTRLAAAYPATSLSMWLMMMMPLSPTLQKDN